MLHGITQCYLPPGRGDIPALTPAEAGTRLSDPGGMQGWVDLSTPAIRESGLMLLWRSLHAGRRLATASVPCVCCCCRLAGPRRVADQVCRRRRRTLEPDIGHSPARFRCSFIFFCTSTDSAVSSAVCLRRAIHQSIIAYAVGISWPGYIRCYAVFENTCFTFFSDFKKRSFTFFFKSTAEV